MTKNAGSGIIDWNNDGDRFAVFDWGRFTKEILGRSQVDKAANSFIRQLNLYGFKKIRSDKLANEAKHDIF